MKIKFKHFAIAVGFTALLVASGCSKYEKLSPLGPTDPDTTAVERYLNGTINYTLSDHTARLTGDFSAYPYLVRAGGQLPLDTIYVYDGKVLPMSPYDHFNLLSWDKKEWFYKGMSGTNLIVTGAEWVVDGAGSWYWLHKEQAPPDTTTPQNNRGPQGCFGMRSDGTALYLSGSVWGKATEGKYGWLIFDYSQFPMDTVYVANLHYANGAYILPFSSLPHQYGHYTMGFGAVVNSQYYYKGRTGCEPTLDGVWEYSADPNWFGFRWDTVVPPPVTIYHTITATAGTGGSISPSGAISVQEGNNQSFTITPGTNYSIASVMVDGANVGAISSYTFSNVRADHSISATFTYHAPPPVVTKGTFKLTTLTPDVTVTLNSNGWAKNGQWDLDPGSYTLVVSKSGFNTYTETFTLSAGQTVERTITLTATTPANPLRADFDNATGVLTLSGDGCTNWLGAECYHYTAGVANWWAKGTVVGDHVEIVIPAPYNHIVIWHDAVAGLQNSGGSGITPRYSDHRDFQAGSGIASITSGDFVLSR